MSHESIADHIHKITEITKDLNDKARAHKRGENTEVVHCVSDFFNAIQEAKEDGVPRQIITAAIDSGARKEKRNIPLENLRNLH
jgi:cobalamin-dependent methionine synthase I